MMILYTLVMKAMQDKLKKTAGAGRLARSGLAGSRFPTNRLPANRSRKQAARGAAKRSGKVAAGAGVQAGGGSSGGGGFLSEREALAFLNRKLEVLEKEAAFLNFAVQETIDLIK